MSLTTTINAPQLEELSVAAQLHNISAQLRGWTDHAALGMMLIVAGLPIKAPLDWVSIGLGFVLFFASYYLKWKLRLPVLDFTIVTIVVALFWQGVRFNTQSSGVSKMAFVVFGPIAFYELFRLWKPRTLYKSLLQKSNPIAVNELESLLETAETGYPLVSPDLSEYRVNSFLRGTQIWRLVRSGDLLLFVKNTKVFENISFAVECFIVERRDVQLTVDGTSSDNEARVTLRIGADRTHRGVLPANMIEKLQGMVGERSLVKLSVPRKE